MPERLIRAVARDSAVSPSSSLVLVPDGAAYPLVEAALDAAGSDAPLFDAVTAYADGDPGVLQLAMAASASLAEALQRACRYEAFWSTSADLVLVEPADSAAKVTCTTVAPPGRGRNAMVAGLLAVLVRAMDRALSAPLALAEVRLRWRPRVDAERIMRQLRVAVRFGATEDALVVDRSLLDTPLPHAYLPFARYFDAHLEQVLQDVAPSSDLQLRVLRALANGLVGGEEGVLSRVARELGSSPRTLQRRLATDGTSFTELLERVRADLACAMLVEGERSIGEVAYALGFSSPAAFGRAFKRWTGLPPGQFRGSR